jgi:trehalose 6-phosphate synthase
MPLYAEAKVGLVTPLRDGMNLVAKEYVAAQDPRDPGVLVLSQFAGAARELDAALVVNPYDQSGVAAALDRALAMEHGERCERHAAMLHVMRRNSLDAWRDRFEADLRGGVDLPRCTLAAEACCDPPEPVVSPTRPSYNPER